jgi:hypothetical protein
MNRLALILWSIGVFSVAFSQRSEELPPVLIAFEYTMSAALPNGSKVLTLFDLAGKPASIPLGRQLVWFIPTDFAESAQDPIRVGLSNASPVANRGNQAIEFVVKPQTKKNIIFFENQNSKKITALDIGKVTTRFSGFNIFLDKDNAINPPVDTVMKQSPGGLFFVSNGRIECRFLGTPNPEIERLAEEFLRSGKVEICPLDLGAGQKVNLPASSFMTTVQGDEWKYNAKDFKIINKINPDGTSSIVYGGDTNAAPRFILEQLDALAKKYNIKPAARVVKGKEIEKLKKLFPNWDFFDFFDKNNENLWKNLDGSLVVVNRQKVVVGNFWLFGSLESTGNTLALESALRKARR